MGSNMPAKNVFELDNENTETMNQFFEDFKKKVAHVITKTETNEEGLDEEMVKVIIGDNQVSPELTGYLAMAADAIWEDPSLAEGEGSEEAFQAKKDLMKEKIQVVIVEKTKEIEKMEAKEEKIIKMQQKIQTKLDNRQNTVLSINKKIGDIQARLNSLKLRSTISRRLWMIIMIS